MRRYSVLLVGLVAAAACGNDVVVVNIDRPQNLFYVLDPSGDPQAPAGILLHWDPVPASDLAVYRVYSRPGSSGQYDLRGETTSTTFHDTGIPDLDYAVSAVSTSGDESALTEVEVDERLRLSAPTYLTSTSLNGAIYLAWDDTPFTSEPDGFMEYRIYSTGYSIDQNLCDETWALEGTTVSPEFVAAALENGIPRCFGVSAESVEGWESLWSPLRYDTPRPDARNVVIYADAANQSQAGFRFFEDLNGNGQVEPGELGLVGAASTASDFTIHRDPGTLQLFVAPAQASVMLYALSAVDDLTSIDVAPVSGFGSTQLLAQPGFGYVFEMNGGDGFARYGAIRTTHVGPDFVIFDWSYQTDPGNPELQVHGGLTTSEAQGMVVRRR
ncbi:MAG TPA: hypothetical protein VF902_10350 [Coriobacteriia bacterium]